MQLPLSLGLCPVQQQALGMSQPHLGDTVMLKLEPLWPKLRHSRRAQARPGPSALGGVCSLSVRDPPTPLQLCAGPHS